MLHVARLSPFAMASSLAPEGISRLYAALRSTLSTAVATASGKPAAELKDAKRAGMRVHGRTGMPCPECGDTVREVSFADSSLQYCARRGVESAKHQEKFGIHRRAEPIHAWWVP